MKFKILTMILSFLFLGTVNGIINPKMEEGTFDMEKDPFYVEVPLPYKSKGFQVEVFEECRSNRDDLIASFHVRNSYRRVHPYDFQFNYPVHKNANIERFYVPYNENFKKIAQNISVIKNPACLNRVITNVSDLWFEISKYYIDYYFPGEKVEEFLTTVRFKNTLKVLSDFHKYGFDFLYPVGSNNYQKLREEIVVEPLYLALVRFENKIMDQFRQLNQDKLALDDEIVYGLIKDFKIKILEEVLSSDEYSPLVVSYFVGKILHLELEKIESKTTIQNIVCKIQGKDCRTRTTNSSLFKIVDLFSVIYDENQFKSKLSRYGDSINQEFNKIFKIIVKNKMNFYKAIDFIKENNFEKCTDIFPQNRGGTRGTLTPYASDLVYVVSKSNEFVENVKRDGTFSGKKLNEIKFTFSDKVFSDVINEFSKRIDDLKVKYDNAVLNKKESIKNFTDSINSENMKLKILNEIKLQEKIVEIKTIEKKSLQNIVKSDRMDLAKYILNFEDMINKFDKDRKSLGIEVEKREISLSPKIGENLDLSREQDYLIEGHKGEFLTFQVEGGYWSPVCALSKEGFQLNDILNVKAGPDGIDVRFSDGKSELKSVTDSVTDSKFSQDTKSEKTCTELFAGAQVTADAGTLFKPVIGSGVSATMTAGVRESFMKCREKMSGTRHSDDHTSTTSQNSQINRELALNIGYRSAYAPFDSFPVGSILLIELAKGDTDYRNARRIIVLDRQSSIFVTEESDYYLVVNDCADALNSRSNPLTVLLKKTRPEGQVALEHKKYLLKAIEGIKGKSEKLIESGQLTGMDIEKLTAEISSEFIQENNGQNLDQSDFLRGLFNKVIKTELSIIEKGARVVEISRVVDLENTKLVNLYSDFEKIDQMSDILNKTNLYFLKINSYSNDWEYELNSHIDFLFSMIIPVTKFRYPEIIREMAKETYKLDTGSENNSILKNVSDFRKFEDILFKKIKEQKIIDVGCHKALVRISIPKLIKTQSIDDMLSSYFQFNDSNYHTLDLPNANEFWINAYSGKNFELKLELDDIYSNSFIGSLSKNVTYPVIESIGIYLVYDHDDSEKLTSGVGHLDIIASNKSMYYLEGNLKEEYIINNIKALRFPIKVMLGSSENDDASFKKWGKETGDYQGQGLSPFTTFKFNLGNVLKGRKGKIILDKTEEIRILLNISYRTDIDNSCVF